MNEVEAQQLLTRELRTWSRRGFEEIASAIGNVQVTYPIGESGADYTVEIDVVWDDENAKTTLRLMGAIDDGKGWRSIAPLCEDIFVDRPTERSTSNQARASDVDCANQCIHRGD